MQPYVHLFAALGIFNLHRLHVEHEAAHLHRQLYTLRRSLETFNLEHRDKEREALDLRHELNIDTRVDVQDQTKRACLINHPFIIVALPKTVVVGDDVLMFGCSVICDVSERINRRHQEWSQAAEPKLNDLKLRKPDV